MRDGYLTFSLLLSDVLNDQATAQRWVLPCTNCVCLTTGTCTHTHTHNETDSFTTALGSLVSVLHFRVRKTRKQDNVCVCVCVNTSDFSPEAIPADVVLGTLE